LDAWNPWATKQALYEDTVLSKSPIVPDQFSYNDKYAAYPGEVTAAVQKAYVLPTYSIDS